MKRIIVALSVILFAFLLVALSIHSTGSQAAPALQEPEPEKPPLPTPAQEEAPEVERQTRPLQINSPVDEAVLAAFERTTDERQMELLAFMIYEPVVDSIHYAKDGKTALLWVALRDPQTGEVVETEPGLAIARSPEANSALPSGWEVTLQSAEDFGNQLRALPEELQTEELRGRYEQADMTVVPNAAVPHLGYRLPWTAGTSRRLSGSISHFLGYNSCNVTSCRYAYDFADGTMFPLIAAKGGTVKAWRVDCPNFGTECTNYLVLEDQSTVPTTYQLYYHMAQNSVPARLRVVGTQVQRGEYIGDVDDTGYSSGHHLHFHIYEKATGSNWSWGYSVDFKFEDVAINDGRPRRCDEVVNWPSYGTECNAGADGKRGTSDDNWFVSGNTPANPPSGTMDAPVDRQWVDRPTVYVAGSAVDDVQISRIQALINYDGVWRSMGDIAPQSNGTYGQEFDLCSLNVPNGPFALTVKIYDREGSQVQNIPVRQLVKNYNCASATIPTSMACEPNANQVALYTEPDYRGACQKFDASGSGYTATMLGAVAENTAASVQVGSNVQAILYDRSSDVTATQPGGRIETFQVSDASLSDNRIGAKTVSGLWVKTRDLLPSEVFIRAPGSKYSGGALSTDSLILAWEGGGGATSFDVALQGPSANWTRNVTTTSISVGNLAAGSYTLMVVAKNNAGSNTSQITFNVSNASQPAAAAEKVPFEDNLDADANGWVSSGLWRYASVTAGTRAASKGWVFNDTTDFSDSVWKAGDLTSPPIELPGGAVSYLRFLYYANTEDGWAHWDQRRVQISVLDGANYGPFVDLVQLWDDKQPAQAWFNSGPISLKDYQGRTVRIRFHFDAIDEDRNTTFGWAIDDVTINTTAPNTACSDGNAVPTLVFDKTIDATICPEGDVDFYYVSAARGQKISFDIDARALSPSSALDSYIYLLDQNGASVLAENDDEEYLKKVDSLLTYTFTRSGTYLLKVKAWNHPGAGSTAHFYKVTARVESATVPPQAVGVAYPYAPTLIPGVQHMFQPTAVDYDGGQVAQIDLYWHGPDWSKPEWVKVGTDSNAADGWAIPVNPTTYGAVNGSALYVQARSKAGGTTGLVWWDLRQDLTMPSSKIAPLPNLVNSTAARITWTAEDLGYDILKFELQYQRDGGAWQNWTERAITGSDRSIWFVGQPGRYGFRIRAIDRAANVEAYPAGPEAEITLSGTCSPDAAENPANTASPITPGSAGGTFNLCTSPGGTDVDWVSMQAEGGKQYIFGVSATKASTAVTATLYNSALQKVSTWTSADFGSPAVGMWKAPGSGTTTYYLEIRPFRADLWGTDVSYRVSYGESRSIYMPMMQR